MTEVGKVCGKCAHTEVVPNDLTKRYCYGLPPFPVAIPGPRGMGIQMIRPVVGSADRPCALYKARIIVDVGGCGDG